MSSSSFIVGKTGLVLDENKLEDALPTATGHSGTEQFRSDLE